MAALPSRELLLPGRTPLHILMKMTIPLLEHHTISSFSFPQQPYRGGTIIRPILKMKKLKYQVVT